MIIVYNFKALYEGNYFCEQHLLPRKETLIKIANSYSLNNLYYSIDNHNIFKRISRYSSKPLTILFFLILFAFEIFEVIFNIVHLCKKTPSIDFANFTRIAGAILSICNIVIIFLLSTFTIVKMSIKTYIYL